MEEARNDPSMVTGEKSRAGICHLENAELEPKSQKFKGRVEIARL